MAADNTNNWDASRKEIAKSSKALVDMVVSYQPTAKSIKSRKGPKPYQDLAETASFFFRTAADVLEGKYQAPAEDAGETTSPLAGLQGLLGNAQGQAKELAQSGSTVLSKADKEGRKLLEKSNKQAAKFLQDAGDRAQDTADNVGKAVKKAKLDKKVANVADNVGKAVKDAKLDKKFANAVDNVGEALKDAKLDKKFNDLRSNVADGVKDLEVDKKATGLLATVGATLESLTDNLGEAIKDAKLDKKFAEVTENIGEAIKDAKLDKKLEGVTETVGQALETVGETLGDVIKDAKLDKKFAEVTENIGEALKDAKLDKKFESVTGTLGETFDNLSSNVEHVLKDAKLDKKLEGVTENVRQGVDKVTGDLKKKQTQALKQAAKQQKKLGKQAGKLFDEQRSNLIEAANTLPFVNIEPPKKKNNTLKNLGVGLAVAGAVAGGLAANNARIWSNVPPLESKLPGDSQYYRSRRGIVFYKEAGTAKEGQPPVVFVHGIGAGNHSYEWLPNFGAFAEDYKCYAYDLLGFGNSERRDIRYTAELYIEQLMEFLEDVVKQPAYVVASSLGAAYAVQVAYRRPELISKLALMSPTGINRQGGRERVGFLPQGAYGLLRAPILDKSIYNLVASRAGIRSFMEEQMFFDRSQVTPEMVEQFYISSHQPGAQYAPPSFFTGKLDASLQELSKIKQPVIVVAGKYGRITDRQEMEALQKLRPDIRLEIIDQARMSVQWERAAQFNRLVLDFLGKAGEDEATLRPEPAQEAAKNSRKAAKLSQATDSADNEIAGTSGNESDSNGHERKALG